MTPEEELIDRLLAMFGEPRTSNVPLFLEEFTNAIKGWNGAILRKAGSEVIQDNTYWPKPAEIIAKCKAIAAESGKPANDRHYYFPSKRGPYDPATVEQWRRAAEWRNSLPDNHPLVRQGNAFTAAIKPMMRDVFEKMQQNSPNRALHAKPLTERSRRMQGGDE